MKKRLFRAFVFAAVLAAGLSMRSVRAADAQEALLADGDPPGATCYHFPLITVCCDGGGCYIER
jgi:hypothetical protein